jgi:hypothetical protein
MAHVLQKRHRKREATEMKHRLLVRAFLLAGGIATLLVGGGAGYHH